MRVSTYVGREILTLGEGFNTQAITLCVFQHSGARDFDLGGGFQHSGNYPYACFNTVGREILTLGEGFNNQVIH